MYGISRIVWYPEIVTRIYTGLPEVSTTGAETETFEGCKPNKPGPELVQSLEQPQFATAAWSYVFTAARRAPARALSAKYCCKKSNRPISTTNRSMHMTAVNTRAVSIIAWPF